MVSRDTLLDVLAQRILNPLVGANVDAHDAETLRRRVDVGRLKPVVNELSLHCRRELRRRPRVRLSRIHRQHWPFKVSAGEQARDPGRRKGKSARTNELIPAPRHLENDVGVCNDENIVADEEHMRRSIGLVKTKLIAHLADIRDQANAEKNGTKSAPLSHAKSHLNEVPRLILVVAPEHNVILAGINIQNEGDQLRRDLTKTCNHTRTRHA